MGDVVTQPENAESKVLVTGSEVDDHGVGDRRDRSADGRVLAYAIYPEGQPTPEGGFMVWGKPTRGVVTLSTCYSPPWWYAVCGACHHVCEGWKDNPDDPSLAQAAFDHRCPK